MAITQIIFPHKQTLLAEVIGEEIWMKTDMEIAMLSKVSMSLLKAMGTVVRHKKPAPEALKILMRGGVYRHNFQVWATSLPPEQKHTAQLLIEAQIHVLWETLDNVWGTISDPKRPPEVARSWIRGEVTEALEGWFQVACEERDQVEGLSHLFEREFDVYIKHRLEAIDKLGEEIVEIAEGMGMDFRKNIRLAKAASYDPWEWYARLAESPDEGQG